MECCPTCHRPLELNGEPQADRMGGLLSEIFADGLTYPEAAFVFRRSVRRLQNLVSEHRLEVRYRRFGSHPRRHGLLPPATIRALSHYLPRALPVLARSDSSR